MMPALKILFITPSYKPAFVYGGPTVSVSELAEELSRQGVAVTVYTTTANGRGELNVPVSKPVEVNGVAVYYFKRLTGDHTHVSPALWRKLHANANRFDIIHIQSWWSLLVIGAAAICWLKNISFIVSPRGMLSQYSFQNLHARSKMLLHKAIGQRLLKRSYLHATTLLEWEDCQAVQPDWEGFLLPNLVKLPRLEQEKKTRLQNDPLILGFLSRVDPKKGLENLLQALAGVSFDFRLHLAGDGEAAYLTKLKSLATQLGLSEKVKWFGWQVGEDKFDFLRSIDVFVLTSQNENFANAVVESLAVGTAVMLSDRVGLADYVRKRDLGWVSTREPTDIGETLNELSLEKAKLHRIARTAPAIVRTDFAHDLLAANYIEAYENLVGKPYRQKKQRITPVTT